MWLQSRSSWTCAIKVSPAPPSERNHKHLGVLRTLGFISLLKQWSVSRLRGVTHVNPGLPLWARSLRSEPRALPVTTRTRPRGCGQTRRLCAWGGRLQRVNPPRWPRPRAASSTAPPSWRRPAGRHQPSGGPAGEGGGVQIQLQGGLSVKEGYEV